MYSKLEKKEKQIMNKKNLHSKSTAQNQIDLIVKILNNNKYGAKFSKKEVLATHNDKRNRFEVQVYFESSLDDAVDCYNNLTTRYARRNLFLDFEVVCLDNYSVEDVTIYIYGTSLEHSYDYDDVEEDNEEEEES